MLLKNQSFKKNKKMIIQKKINEQLTVKKIKAS